MRGSLPPDEIIVGPDRGAVDRNLEAGGNGEYRGLHAGNELRRHQIRNVGSEIGGIGAVLGYGLPRGVAKGTQDPPCAVGVLLRGGCSYRVCATGKKIKVPDA